MQIPMQILVFKTDLSDHSHISKIEPFLDMHPGVSKWNVDLKDCDNILRIEATSLKGNEIEKILGNAGFFCEELM